ncbi:oligosaccharide flippase family protein [Chroococcidiopsis sp. CCMEE 29]|uniref:lipopolysaccharide biosynthesis protein n=1 Tax=Chroococcidiopsis sp. CCMEE 29 TaxID=155894 RepID=UPI00201FEBCF|nr:oligosaccharide flippase family protein [Chroococcidiopsis sp. CCMEE 29]
MKTIFKGARWIWGGRTATAATVQTVLVRVLILATNMGTGIITARALGPDGRGEQAAMALWPQFLAYAMTLGLPAALRYNLKRYPDQKTELFSAALLLSILLGIAATLVGIVFLPQWLSQYSPEVIRFAQWLMLLSPMILLSGNFVAALEATEDFTTANQAQYLAPLMTLVLLGLLAVAQILTPFTAVLAYVIPGLPIFFWLLHRTWKYFRPRWQRLGSSYKRLTSYGLRAYGIDLLGTLSGQVDQALVVNLLPPASMGLYVVALSLSRMLSLFHSSIITVLLPKTAARPVEEVVALTGRAARVGMVLTVLTAIAVIIPVPILLRLLYGAEFLEAVPVFRILIVEEVIGGTAWVLSQAFMALGRPGTVAILQALGLGLSVPLMILFIPAYGLEGAGLALLCSTVLRLVLVLTGYPTILKVRPPGLIMTKEDWRFLQQVFRLNKS